MTSLLASPTNFVRQDRPGRRAAGHLNDLTARLALDPQTRRDAFSVRHESYLSGGYIDRQARGEFRDRYDDLPNAQTIVLYKDARPVASVRVCILDSDPAMTGWDKIPAGEIFPDEVMALLAKVPHDDAAPGLPRAIEINRLVRHPDFATDFELVFALFRVATFFVRFHKTHLMLSCVRQNHGGFYKRLHFNTVAGPRRYAGVKFETNLMACYRSNYDDVLRSAPIFESGAMTNGCYDGLFLGESVAVFAEG